LLIGDKMKVITKEEHQSSICHQDCYHKKEWTREMPYVVESYNIQVQINTMLVCLSCVHFVGFDNYIKEDYYV